MLLLVYLSHVKIKQTNGCAININVLINLVFEKM